jgi:hypothetical protein
VFLLKGTACEIYNIFLTLDALYVEEGKPIGRGEK